ncbi:MAG: 4Fe-4S dicluster domain-containing protein [Firmicutes bacterium]|nr:4Fe-4S dicluster domain-containing protein [Bacillota bacterium]
MNTFAEELSAYLFTLGAHKVGFADLKPHRQWLESVYSQQWQDYPYAISVAVNFPRAVINEVAFGPTLTYVRYYDALNTALDHIGFLGAEWLDTRGYKAYPIPASQMMGENHLQGIFSHRATARIAGLGWVGKSCSIITPDRGPRQRFCTIMTNAPLPAGQPLQPRCASCNLCTQICPVQAIKNVIWQEEQPLSERLDTAACYEFLLGIRKTFGKSVCGRCLAVCPFGKDK